MATILAIDSGNSNLKWGLFERNQWATLNRINNDNISSINATWQSLKQPEIIIISQVSIKSIHQQIATQITKLWDTQPHWITSQSKQCGVTNRYEIPAQLGSDRWAALIAAWNRFYASCLVVNVGTAMTVDVLSNEGVFLGGVIVPGPALMQKSLQDKTKLLDTTGNNDFHYFPTNTGTAVYSGVIQALVGAIEKMNSIFIQKHGYPIKNYIFSGGGVTAILPYIDFPHIVIDENLVLEGLLLIADDLFQGKVTSFEEN